jgi:imidazole glycerol-phosphate synthase subunit HisF
VTGTRLKRRLIPRLLIEQRQVGLTSRPVLVTTRQYRTVLDAGDPVSQARIYEAQLADELIVLNIAGTPIAGDEAMLGLIRRLASETFMPLAVGGGVRTTSDFATLLEAGADKVSINSAALDHPELITEAASRFGAQCVVVSIDFRETPAGARVFRDHAAHDTGLTVGEWAREAVARGAGELLLVDADRDGMGCGLNVEVARAVTDQVPVPVILGGGCGSSRDFIEGFTGGGVQAVTAGTFFCFRDQNPMQTRAQIRNAGIPIRMGT